MGGGILFLKNKKQTKKHLNDRNEFKKGNSL